MIRTRKGTVKEIISKRDDASEVIVEYDGELHDAINYNKISGDIECGDTVYLNVTASFLNLGTGGYDFVVVNATRGENLNLGSSCGIMKMKYAPCQVGFDYSNSNDEYNSLDGMVVLIGELHSMLPAAACSLKYILDDIKICYIMTDGGCLISGFSSSLYDLKKKGVINSSVTYGSSSGGDFEAVNIYDALIISRHIAGCDAAIVTMGPGSLGTGTKYGFSGIEQGFAIDAANTLGGVPVYIPRISFADTRCRHYGISHHTITVLSEIAKTRCQVVIPKLCSEKHDIIMSQIMQNNINIRHDLVIEDSDIVFNALKYYNVDVSTMGRGLYQDRDFFITCGCAAKYGSSIVKKS